VVSCGEEALERGSFGFVVGDGFSLCRVIEAAHGTALEDDAMRIMEEAIEDRIPEGGVSHDIVPVVDGHLAGEESASPSVAIVQEVEEIVAGSIVQRRHPPVVEDEQVGLGQALEKAAAGAVASGHAELLQEP
jgi:hypothetical protein